MQKKSKLTANIARKCWIFCFEDGEIIDSHYENHMSEDADFKQASQDKGENFVPEVKGKVIKIIKRLFAEIKIRISKRFDKE